MSPLETGLETQKSPFNLHVFVCTNTRPPGGKESCGPQGAEALRADLKDWLKTEFAARPGLTGKVKARLNGSACLDFCSKGIAVAVYPQRDLILNVKPSSDPNAIQKVKTQLRQYLDELEKR